MAVYRVNKNRGYTVMANFHLRDKSLSLKAVGLLSKMLSFNDGWKFSTKGLSAICKEGPDAILSALRELEKHGYLVRHRQRDGKGRMSSTIFEIYEEPQESTPEREMPHTENPCVEKPDVDNPRGDKSAQINTDQVITQERNTLSKNYQSINLDGMDRMDERSEYGRDIAMDEQGRFTDEGYVRVASERWDRQFDGELDDIPDEYRITGSGEAAERDSTIAVLVVEPGKEPYVKEIDSDLKSLQHEVGGCIEAIYPYEDPVALVCNEEGKLEGLPLNRALRDEDGDIYDVVAGTFMVVGLTDDSFGSLTVEQMQKFSDHFKVPEQFAKLGDKIVAIPMISKEQQKRESVEQKDFEMNADTSGLTVAGHIGTWHTIDQHEVGGHSFYLMEHDAYGDEAACIIVDERGKLVLDDVYNGFDDDTLRLLDLEVKEVPEMPDPALSVQDMKDYGYAWAGVLPAGQEAAEKALEKGCEVYRLYSDNTEGLCVDAKEIADHAAKGGMLGISKESWMAALEKENYLKAAEMSMEDDYGMIDGIINNGPKEDKTLDAKAPDTGEKSSIMDRLKSAKAEKQKDCCPPKKHKGEIEL